MSLRSLVRRDPGLADLSPPGNLAAFSPAPAPDPTASALSVRNAPPTTLLPSPILKLRLAAGGHPEVCWKKRHFTGLVIEVDRGAGWELLAQDTIPHYLDKFPLPKAGAVWKYRAVYVLADTRVGQWSDVASITVGAGE